VYAEYIGNGSLTPGLNYYRANVPPQAIVGPPLELPPIQAPTMGVWSTEDFALLEPQMKNSGAFCANTFRYERVAGINHWLQWEAPGTVNGLLLDFLPR
jgi:pimeloyl-ACP methyl ester carboxylesterase